MIDWWKCPPVGCMLTMFGRTRARLVPFVLCAMGVLSLVLAGCRKEEKKPETPASSPASYMRDPVFRGKLAAERKEHVRLTQERNAIVLKMTAMIDAKKEELKTDDIEVVRAALENDPAWRELYAACTNANAAVESQRRKALGTVRERLAPEKISK